jgi:hypothetical protein
MAEHMAWSILGDLLLVAHDEEPPGDEEWARWLRDFDAHAPALRATLVCSTGGGPTSSQRKDLLAVIDRHKRVPRTLILTSSAVMRGLVTAIGWFLPAERRAKMYRPDEMARALEYLAVDPVTGRAVQVETARLAASLRATRSAALSTGM